MSIKLKIIYTLLWVSAIALWTIIIAQNGKGDSIILIEEQPYKDSLISTKDTLQTTTDSHQETKETEPKATKTCVNVNSASVDELMTLPGVGEVTAKRIIEIREKQKFSKTQDLDKVKGIGPAKLAKLKPLVCF